MENSISNIAHTCHIVIFKYVILTIGYLYIYCGKDEIWQWLHFFNRVCTGNLNWLKTIGLTSSSLGLDSCSIDNVGNQIVSRSGNLGGDNTTQQHKNTCESYCSET